MPNMSNCCRYTVINVTLNVVVGHGPACNIERQINHFAANIIWNFLNIFLIIRPYSGGWDGRRGGHGMLLRHISEFMEFINQKILSRLLIEVSTANADKSFQYASLQVVSVTKLNKMKKKSSLAEDSAFDP